MCFEAGDAIREFSRWGTVNNAALLALRRFFMLHRFLNTRNLVVLAVAALGLGVLFFQRDSHSALPAMVEGQPIPSLAPMLERVTPGVVNISTTSRVPQRENPLLDDPFFRRFFDIPEHNERGKRGERAPRERRSQSLGSGVVIDAAKGLVITNAHVIDKAEEITVTLHDGRNLPAKLVGADPESDIAVVRVESNNLTALKPGDSEQLRVGDFVVAIGSPFGLSQTVTSGIVSAKGRRALGIEGYEDFIQTDASINPGNSGGALVNLRGELVGINTAIFAPSGGNVGIGFAIPVNMVRNIADQLAQHGEIKRGRLGVYIQDLTPELAKAFETSLTKGAVIAQIEPGSAAERAGLKEGDVVTTVNGRAVEDAADLRNAIGLLRVGDTVSLGLLRQGKNMDVKAKIGQAVEQKAAAKDISPRLAGAELATVAEDQFGGRRRGGVLVVSVQPDSPAQQAGLRKDDVIVSANKKPVANVEELRKAAQNGGRALVLNIQRGDGALFLVLE
jgi:serine protease Do/serine protease DegQ